jgi:hypothetical protein
MTRLVATFGIGNRGNIYNLIRQVVNQKFMMIGSGRNHKSLAYVENVAAFLDFCRAFDSGIHIYNYTDKPDYDMNALVADIRSGAGQTGGYTKIPYFIGLCGGVLLDMIASITGRKFPISAIRVRKFCANTVVNADKAHQSGFKAPYSMKDGLAKTIKGDVF